MKFYNINIETLEQKHLNSCYALHFEKIVSDSKVLDVGCANGKFGEFLNQEKNCTVVGLDCCKEAIDEAKAKNIYKELFLIDLNNLNNELEEYTDYFDYILFSDVLEHLYSPEKLIKKLKPFLKNDGKILLSVPNISHGSIKLKLLKNKFEYTESGLLDNTHIKFFTLDNLVNMLSDLNLQICNLDRVFLDIEASEQYAILSDYPLAVRNFVQKDFESYTYQFVVQAKTDEAADNSKYLKISDYDRKKQAEFLKTIKKPILRRIGRSIEKSLKKLRKKHNKASQR